MVAIRKLDLLQCTPNVRFGRPESGHWVRHAGLHDRVRLCGRDGAVVHSILLAPAARRGVRGQGPPAEDCRLEFLLINRNVRSEARGSCIIA